MKDKKFMLFGGYDYYPRGGIEDFLGFFDSLDEAVEYAKSKLLAQYGPEVGWAQIVDLNTKEIHEYYANGIEGKLVAQIQGGGYPKEVMDNFKPAQLKEVDND